MNTEPYNEESICNLRKRKSELLLRLIEAKDERGEGKRWGETLQAWCAGTHT